MEVTYPGDEQIYQDRVQRLISDPFIVLLFYTDSFYCCTSCSRVVHTNKRGLLLIFSSHGDFCDR
jgi:hypothetical protein